MMKTRQDLQPWIESVAERPCSYIIPGIYITSMKSALQERDMEKLARNAFCFGDCHGVRRAALLAACREVSATKGQGYAGEDDFLANFYRGADREQIPVMTVVAIYVWKHIDWIDTFERTNTVHGSEGLESRLGDVILYAALGKAIQYRELGDTKLLDLMERGVGC